MKVSFRRVEEKEGVVFKKQVHTLFVDVELSSEEIKAIKAAGVEDYVLLEYSYKDLELDWKVSDLLYDNQRRSKGKDSERRFVAADAVSRKGMEEQLKQGLAGLKAVIDDASLEEPQESFEL